MTWKAFWVAAGVIPAAFLAFFFAYPVFTMLGTGLGSDGSFTEVAFSERNLRIVAQTLGQALAGTIGSIVLGLPAAYVLYRLEFPGVRALRAFAMIPFVLPTVVVGVAFRSLLGRGGPLEFLGLDETIGAVVLALVFFNVSVVVRTVGSMWRNIGDDMVAAARTLGASRARAFATVTLPQLLPAIGSAATIVFLFCMTSYGLVRTLGSPGYGTLETEIWRQSTAFLNMHAASVLAVVQIIVVFGVLAASAFFSRRTVAIRITTARKAPTAGDLVPLSVTVVTMIVLVAGPLLTLIVRSFQTRDGWSLENYRRLSGTGQGFAGSASVTEAMMTSVRTALAATLIAIIIGTLIALVTSRQATGLARWGQMGLSGFMVLPLGVSAVTVGFGFLLALSAWRDSPFIIPIAQATVAVPLVVSAMTPMLAAIPPAQREAARTLGASRWRVLATIDGPVLGRALTLAAGFALAASLGEFGATSFLATPEHQTLPVIIVRLLGRPGDHNYGMAMAASVILAVVTAAVMAASEAARRD